MSTLREMHHRVSGMVALRCGLKHEAVARDADGALVRGLDGVGGWVRGPLCDAQARGRNLACAHTLARLTLRDALTALEQAAAVDEATLARLRADWNEFDGMVGRLDHARTDAELARADAIVAGDPTAEAAADARARDVVSRHHSAVEGLEALRDAILVLIERCLAAPTAGAPLPPPDLRDHAGK